MGSRTGGVDHSADAAAEIDAQCAEWLDAAEGNTLLRLRIRRWAALARVLASSAAGADITSYSIGGRSVTKADIPALARECDRLADEIADALGLRGSGVLVADLRGAMA